MRDPIGTGDLYSGDGQKSAGQLMREVSEDLSTLVRKEIELAKQELGEAVGAKVAGAVIVAVAGVMATFAFIFLLLALRDGLSNVMWVWAADLVTAGVLLLVGGIGALVAKRKLATPISTELTKKTIQDDLQWAKTLGKR